MKYSFLLAISVLLLGLAGCTHYPDGEKIYWGNINQAVKDVNASAPKRTNCVKVDDQILCQTK